MRGDRLSDVKADRLSNPVSNPADRLSVRQWPCSSSRRASPAQVALREVGLRDGLQGVKAHLQTAVKCDWVLLAHAAGVTEIEVGAFVAPDRAPSMAD
ncbi:MAG TPA: hypothetical protein VFR86_04090, partial [Burkholderiaceae bacterium]|nr:hypothetical protein [Burkholderiaceae bacterium]